MLSSENCTNGDSSGASLAFLRVFRLIRIFKLTKHSAGLQVLILTFKASIKGLCLFLVAMFVCILLFSSAIFYAEHGRMSYEFYHIKPFSMVKKKYSNSTKGEEIQNCIPF
jgi:hypothetical protein